MAGRVVPSGCRKGGHCGQVVQSLRSFSHPHEINCRGDRAAHRRLRCSLDQRSGQCRDTASGPVAGGGIRLRDDGSHECAGFVPARAAAQSFRTRGARAVCLPARAAGGLHGVPADAPGQPGDAGARHFALPRLRRHPAAARRILRPGRRCRHVHPSHPRGRYRPGSGFGVDQRIDVGQCHAHHRRLRAGRLRGRCRGARVHGHGRRQLRHAAGPRAPCQRNRRGGPRTSRRRAAAARTAGLQAGGCHRQ